MEYVVQIPSNKLFLMSYKFVSDEEYLKRLFLQCKGRMEIAKSVLDMYFTVRGKIPEVMSNRDPCQPWFRTISDIV